jgi:hypothetical protein
MRGLLFLLITLTRFQTFGHWTLQIERYFPPTYSVSASQNLFPRQAARAYHKLPDERYLTGLESQPPFAMKPGTPVSTTELSLLLILIRLISSTATSGISEML